MFTPIFLNNIDINKEFAFLVEDYEVMQFTGLKDKNGKEIYEGHILKVPYNYIGNKEVVFENGKFNIVDYNVSDLEIIGNKFENPELLTND